MTGCGSFLAAVLLGFAASAALAAATNEVATLPSVVVTASPVTQTENVSKDGAESVLVAREQLALLNAQDIQTALRQVPGVTISRYSPIGSYGGAQGGSVYIRGLGTARPGGEVRVYTDGAPRESGMSIFPNTSTSASSTSARTAGSRIRAKSAGRRRAPTASTSRPTSTRCASTRNANA